MAGARTMTNQLQGDFWGKKTCDEAPESQAMEVVMVVVVGQMVSMVWMVMSRGYRTAACSAGAIPDEAGANRQRVVLGGPCCAAGKGPREANVSRC